MTTTQIDDLHNTYANSAPFPHIVIDDHFDRSRVIRIAEEIQGTVADASAEFYGQHRKGGTQDRSRMGSDTVALLEELNGPAFVAWLEWVTGIHGLIADHSMFGGGVHQVGRGGFLKIHTDFSWHEGLRLHRRVNVLLYLNPDWREEWGGHLELWPASMEGCAVRIAPLLGRMVVFSTTDESFHGHPEPLACPADVTRNSIALYYYTQCQGRSRSTLTNYRPRPGERFSGARRLLHKAKRVLHG
ncbi:MAG: 2OG-Fe(II) oxygenase [Sphingomonas sp.]|uniref:2OG-Fe(II) oxygenase n=1 Tax=Sphingomonas sp. TaxID=28214 RepID=UPI001B041056|nr:2OG-Fe(II) oxygenase [Sphingomonas sp.]MBO9622880.1 2OG-Fe(II) oxygenase [Sphingomonas sp.]